MRQRKWIGQILRGDSLLRAFTKGKMEGQKRSGRPRQAIPDWMMANGY